MSTSSAVLINVILDAAIVVAILALLGWGIRANVRDMTLLFAERRRGIDRRRTPRGISAYAKHRPADRRDRRPAAAYDY